jgi:hypothetical protein
MTLGDVGRDMKKVLAAIMLTTLAPVAQARPIDWQAELDRCRSLREQTEPLLRAGVGVSAVARSGTAARRCVWMEQRALKRGAH